MAKGYPQWSYICYVNECYSGRVMFRLATVMSAVSVLVTVQRSDRPLWCQSVWFSYYHRNN